MDFEKIKLNGKDVDGRVNVFQNLDITGRGPILFAEFKPGVVVKLDDIVEHHRYGKRKILQLPLGSEHAYALSEPMDD